MDPYLLEQLYQNNFFRIILIVLGALSAQVLTRHFAKQLIHRVVHGTHHKSKSDERKREKTLITITRTTATVAIWVIAIILILAELDVNLAALATGAGLVGVIFGFGAQSLIGDLLAGTFIISENQYRVGDIITLNAGGKEISGIVEDVNMRITRLRDLDGDLHTVRNGLIDTVSNRSFDFSNVNIDVSVSYDTDIDKVETVINQVGAAMEKNTLWADSIIEPITFLRVDAFLDSAISIKALGKVQPGKQWEVAGEFRRRLKVAFDKAGILIPYPQVLVHTTKGRR